MRKKKDVETIELSTADLKDIIRFYYEGHGEEVVGIDWILEIDWDFHLAALDGVKVTLKKKEDKSK